MNTSELTYAGPSGQRPPPDLVGLPTELLEHILHYLPTKDLLLAQRVCSRWHTLINDSLKLQEDLFLQPVEPAGGWSYTEFFPRSEKAWLDLSRESDVETMGERESKRIGQRFDAILARGWQHYKSFRSIDDSSFGLKGDGPVVCEQTRCAVGRLNILLLSHREDDNSLSVWESIEEGGGTRPRIEPAALRKPSAKYRRMLLSQPPFLELDGYLIYTRRTNPGGWRKRPRGDGFFHNFHIVLRNDQGITIGELQDRIRRTETENDAQLGGGMFMGAYVLCPSPEQWDDLIKGPGEETGMFRPPGYKESTSEKNRAAAVYLKEMYDS